MFRNYHFKIGTTTYFLDLSWSDTGGIASISPTVSGWTSNDWQQSDMGELILASSTPGLGGVDSSQMMLDFWMDRKRSLDNVLLQECRDFLYVKEANSAEF